MAHRKHLEMDVQFIKGAGPARKKILERLGIATIEDLLHHRPRTYLDRSHIVPIASLRPGNTVTIEGVFGSVSQRRTRQGKINLHALLSDETGSISLIWFNQPFLQKIIRSGVKVTATGTVGVYQGLQILNPEFDILTEREGPALSSGRIVPIYPLTAGIGQRGLRTLIRSALDTVLPHLTDPIPVELRSRLKLLPIEEALEGLHFPDSMAEAEASRRRLAFDELFFLQLLMALERKRYRRPGMALPLRGTDRLVAAARASLPFQLTGAQERVLTEILGDLDRDYPMNRLLEGDVGSGKTIVAILAALAAIEAGAQVALMAPTEILAQQHARTAAQILDPLGLPWCLLLGRMPVREKREARDRLISGEAKLALGTQALIQDEIQFEQLGLVIADEQQRFGVLQRSRLLSKGRSPHGLVMTATPIPRTLAMTLYGDLDLSILDEKPPGRRPPRTRRVPESRRHDLIAFLAQSLGEGCQIYVVCPLIEQSELSDLKAATDTADLLAAHPLLRRYRIGLLHGRLSGEEKNRLMQEFCSGDIHLLVTTTVVEVGVDVPNANIMVVEHPERYGLSQLHQLRGRVGRGRQPSHFFLMVGSETSPEARERLSVLVRETDGFRVAEEDLKFRGPGDFFGVAQSGLPPLKMADLQGDAVLISLARQEAQQWTADLRDPDDPKTRRMLDELLRRYRDRVSLYRVG
ncbi:MAG: ATP-dependent DNA helicase RecG [Candidatus Eisenbacteria bacterium]|uniref:ATP-dependent DNA helicase RecG n=1 Tax=Eiseniibacteriota bacterium TaxID=2212470 RepID=A0A948S0D2_UNCEI|nr:ATP-dependent DNA helicase RecG [Candidatus Eisenbacteria bacterium]MBU1949329.1 ATP-dependent DNA helicase RecG [Candidatus Eisenbacteria bacterium]MBU2692957.1 ATP-dependent DNA helicase RecG [Candidatus Eisenbacteria bacterium]